MISMLYYVNILKFTTGRYFSKQQKYRFFMSGIEEKENYEI